jgi:hypothetical protein
MPLPSPPVPVTELQKRRSNHFSDEAIDRGGFPDHISRDGKAFYRDDTPTVPVAEGEEPLSRDVHVENLINLFSRKAEELHKVPGAFTNQLAIVAADYMSKHTRAIPSPVDPLEFWADLAEVLGHDRGEVNPASLVTEVSNRLVTRSPVDVEQQVREVTWKAAIDAAHCHINASSSGTADYVSGFTNGAHLAVEANEIGLRGGQGAQVGHGIAP